MSSSAGLVNEHVFTDADPLPDESCANAVCWWLIFAVSRAGLRVMSLLMKSVRYRSGYFVFAMLLCICVLKIYWGLPEKFRGLRTEFLRKTYDLIVFVCNIKF